MKIAKNYISLFIMMIIIMILPRKTREKKESKTKLKDIRVDIARNVLYAPHTLFNGIEKLEVQVNE